MGRVTAATGARDRPSRKVNGRVPPVPAPDPAQTGLDPAAASGESRSRSALRRDALYKRTLAAADSVSAALGLAVGILAVGGKTPELPIIAALPLVVLVNKVIGLYDRDELLLRRTTLEEAPTLFQGAVAYSLLIWIGGRFLVSEPLHHGEVLALFGLLFASSMLARVGVRWVLRRLAVQERCLVLGDAAAAATIARSFEDTPVVNAAVVGHVPMAPWKGTRPRQELASLAKVIRERAVDRVVMYPGGMESEPMLHALRLVKDLGVKVSVVPRLFHAVGSSAKVDEIDGLLLLGLCRGRLTTWSRRLKRTADVVGAVALMALVAPLVVIATGLRVTAPGRALLARARSAQALQGLGQNALPQLRAVLSGEMSLVGPRPLATPSAAAPAHSNGHLTESHGDGLPKALLPQELNIAPGITGLWRTHGHAAAPHEEDVNLDYLYGANWSLWLDVRIMIRSIPWLFEPGRPGAYEAASTLPREHGAGAALRNGNGRNGNGSHLLERAAPARRSGGALMLPPRGKAAADRSLTVTAVVPATNSPPTLAVCVDAIRHAIDPPEEVIVVDDPGLRGPAAARNFGAARATGDILVFVDADVVVHPDAFTRIRENFETDSGLGGVFGSYDDGIPTSGPVGTFRNLLHHHVHHSCAGEAGTFWSGLGAVRREAFRSCGGFDAERFQVPSVEDIDLGMRLTSGGSRIVLNPRIQGTHLKNWGLREMLETDFSRRGIPWVTLVLRGPGAAPTTLNLSWRHRLSAGFSFLGLCGLVAGKPRIALGAVASLLGLNGRFYTLLARRHGLRISAAGFGLHVLHHLVSIAAVPFGVAAYIAEGRSRRSGAAPGTVDGSAGDQVADDWIASLARATASDSAGAMGDEELSRIAV
jgi:lipopolysaccharide/colanic/teichoic acid biosynthesis glycosyltransferase